jgi:tetratricopeptide (TPR) repeat protein
LQYALNNKADILLRKGNFEKSLEIYQIQAEICRDTHNYYGLQYSLCSQGTIYSDRGDYQRAIQLFSEHYDICKKIYRIFERKRSLGLTGLSYFNIGEIELAKDKLLEQYRLSKDGKYFHEGVNSFLHLIFILELAGDDIIARQYQQKAIEVVKHQDPSVLLAKLLWNQSIIYDIDGNFDYISDFSWNLQEISNLFGISEKDMADLNFSVTNQAFLDELARWYLECEHECKKIGYLMGLQYFLGCQGILHAMKKDYNSAIPLFADQYTICKKMCYSKGEAVSLGRLAKSYLAKGDLNKSELYGKEQSTLCIEKGLLMGNIDSKTLFGLIHVRKKEYLKAIEYLDDCEKNLKERNNLLLYYQIMMYKAAIFFNDKRYEQSLHCINLLHEYLQSKSCFQALNFLKMCQKVIYSVKK